MNEIRISGFGGQGIIRCGYIVGKTASIYDDRYATLTQSFGPEARGSACSAQVLVDDNPIRYPYVDVPDTVVAMSQEAYDKFGSNITKDGTLIIDEDLVKPGGSTKGGKLFSIPATRIAEQLGNRIVANIVMLGFFTAVTDIITAEAVRKALPSSVPGRFVDLNLNAFEQGYEYGLKATGREPDTASEAPKKPAKKTKTTRGSGAKAKKPAAKRAKSGAAPKKATKATGKRKKAAGKARPRGKAAAGSGGKRKASGKKRSAKKT